MNTTISMSATDQHGYTEQSRGSWITWALAAAALAMIVYGFMSHKHEGAGHGPTAAPHMLAVAPFVVILLCIAILPLVPATHHWWEQNRNKLMVSLVLGSITIGYYWLASGVGAVLTVLDHAILAEYIPFIVLLFSLYVISGGICLKGDLAAHPLTNTTFLGIGTLLASFVGTTGASMLLIRPLLNTNAERKHVKHTVIFFIFLVSNVGGCLLPIGDPPLFLGYLKGVPFLWTFHLWKEWLFMAAILLVVYFVWDTLAYRHEEKRDIQRDETQRVPLRLNGTLNILWLMGVVFCVGVIKPGEPLLGTDFVVFPFLREALMLGLVMLSLLCTKPSVRADNKFNYGAILEVAALFIGIFITMQVPMQVLHASGDAIGKVMDSPAKFFWATGILSSFLDNAPTYVVFFEVANAMTHEAGPGIFQLLDGNFIRQDYLIAISLGAVFMGANTYIGNGPNFMVKSIAEQSGVRMPSFFGYMAYSLGILIPLFVLITFLFLM